MKTIASLIGTVLLLVVPRVSHADARVTAKPAAAIPGGAVLVTVTGATDTPEGTAGGTKLHFFAARGGYQAVVSIPIDQKPGDFEVAITGATAKAMVKIGEHTFPETSVIVEDEMANPGKDERDRIDADNAAIREAFHGATGAPAFKGKFRAPARGKVTSVYGEWRTFNDGHRSQHLGYDLAARDGTPVKVAAAGKVALIRDCFLAGNVVVVDHGAGIATAYFHLGEIAVKEGQQIAAGARVGTAGMTGRTTGPHVHLSVWVDGGFVDPASFLRLDLRPTAPKASAKQTASAATTTK